MDRAGSWQPVVRRGSGEVLLGHSAAACPDLIGQVAPGTRMSFAAKSQCMHGHDVADFAKQQLRVCLAAVGYEPCLQTPTT